MREPLEQRLLVPSCLFCAASSVLPLSQSLLALELAANGGRNVYLLCRPATYRINGASILQSAQCQWHSSCAEGPAKARAGDAETVAEAETGAEAEGHGKGYWTNIIIIASLIVPLPLCVPYF